MDLTPRFDHVPRRPLRPNALRTPTVVNRGALTYFFDGEGNRWRIYDSVERPHHGRPYRLIFPLGDPQATVRCFAPDDKMAAHYVVTFQSEADREVTVEQLTAQLRAAHVFYRRLHTGNFGKPR